MENDYNTFMKKALFLDRDGVINEDKGYTYKIEEFVFKTDIFKALKVYQDLGYLIMVVTNQSGINRGYYTEEDFLQLTAFMCKELKKQGVVVAKVYHCPHRPEEECECRKPKPTMLLKAQREFNIDMQNSIMIGDKLSDMQAGYNAGIKKLFLVGDEIGDFYKNAKNIYDTIRFLKDENGFG